MQLGHTSPPVSVQTGAGRIVYRLIVDVPATALRAPVRIELSTRTRPWRPRVVAVVPECLRHRYGDGSLCMWWERDPNERRWMMSDGLAALIHYVQVHLYQEACCRAGESWPGEEAPGLHVRKRSCATCGGSGR